ncbi:MAG: trypsin-like peptidase domain-containing protein [Chloroflexi bacterium]|nr:trypsin-like peptidase domain-containing protein [Chloroflexota bacterium]
MKPNIFNRFWLMLTVLALAALACNGGQTPVAPTTPENPTNNTTPTDTGNGLSQSDRAKLISATVQIYGLFNENGQLTPRYTGSGTILTSSGMILTNAHVASPASQGEPDMEPDALGIAIVESEDKPPVPSYLAQVRAVDGFLDLAVIQITSTVDGSSVDPNSLNFPFVELGDSNQIHVGDHVSIFGFPGIGGDTITFTQGSVSGFTSENPIGDRAWIKTDATIAGGNSGGLAADDQARIIGVPTQASSGGSGDVTDCRQIQDTNKDGTVDQNDSCIPIGGFINALRPIYLAQPLIQAAQAGREYVSQYTSSGVVTDAGSGNEAANNFVWLEATYGSDGCDLGNVVTSFPSSALCIGTGFDYSGMTAGELVREQWYLNGQPASEYSYSWEWETDGSFGTFLPNGGDPMPQGEYYVEIYAGSADHLIGTSGKVSVGSGGGGTTPPPVSSGDTITVYGVVTDADTGNPISGAYVFILSPGITYEQWGKENYADKYIVASLKTTGSGGYSITEIPRNTLFTIVFAADGYLDKFGDNLQASSSDPEQFELNVALNK